ncbi:MAG TPA: type II toxin-antitoxin system ParD family antitoxin [Bacteroidetes bacterium]|nr:type II toxin-antitoxin system ParD family antitoxin [Bacteroidota bacterium]
MASTITFRPTEEQGGFIDGMIESGDFSNQSEVIRAGIRLLQEQRIESKLTQLRQLVREGENSPIIDDWSGEGFIGRMKKKHNV